MKLSLEFVNIYLLITPNIMKKILNNIDYDIIVWNVDIYLLIILNIDAKKNYEYNEKIKKLPKLWKTWKI